jgi:hypothetical protein
MSDTTKEGDEGGGVFVTSYEDYPDVVCQRAVAMCRVAEVIFDLGEDAELRSELLTMLKKLNTSVDLPTSVKTAKLSVIK